MAEHPLLPHQRLRELYALLGRARKLCRRCDGAVSPSREALLAATLIHLAAGDLVSGEPDDAALASLASTLLPDAAPSLSADLPSTAGTDRLVLSAAAARGVQAAGRQGLTIAFTSSRRGDTAGWRDALAWAVDKRLPLLVVCSDDHRKPPTRSPARTAKSGNTECPFTWTELNRLTRQIRVPVFSMDGEDAVAVYRVVQETVLRARSGDGPSVLWAVLGAETSGKPLDPLARLRKYMSARDIALSE